MRNSLSDEAEKLVIQCHVTLSSQPGTPLRIEKIVSEHRQLIRMVEEMIEQSNTREDFLAGVLRLVRNIFANSSTGTNGRKSWTSALPQNLKTALILLYQFIQRHR